MPCTSWFVHWAAFLDDVCLLLLNSFVFLEFSHHQIGLDIDRFKDISDDLDFSQKLLREQSVFVLPGQVDI